MDAWGKTEVIAQILSAFGTLAAVIVALYIASRDRRFYLDVFAGIRQLVSSGPPSLEGGDQDFVMIQVTNLGARPVTIVWIGWQVGRFKPATFVQIHDYTNYMSSKLPVTLNDGGSASFPIPLKAFGKNSIISDKSNGKLVRIFVVTSVSRKRYFGNVEKPLLDHIHNMPSSQG